MRLLFELDKKDYKENGTRFVRPSVRGIIIKNGKVAMIHSLKYDYYKFPGGGIEQNEAHANTLIREVKEEAGLVVIPSTIKEYGMVRRIQKGQVEDIFVQENFYYLCDVENEVGEQKLDDYEAEEEFTLEFVSPEYAIDINRNADHGLNAEDTVYAVMIEREALVLEKLLSEKIMDEETQEKLVKAWELFDSGAYDEAEAIYLECWNQVGQSEHDDYESVLMGLIYVESFSGKYDEARMYAKLLLEAAQDEEEKHIAIHQAGMVERMAENYSEAMRLFQQEAEIISSSFSEDALRIATNLYEQAYVSMKMGALERAEEKMKLSLEYAKQSGDDMCAGCAYRGMGEILSASGDNAGHGKVYFEKAIEAFESAGDQIAVEEVKVLMEREGH